MCNVLIVCYEIPLRNSTCILSFRGKFELSTSSPTPDLDKLPPNASQSINYLHQNQETGLTAYDLHCVIDICT